MDTVVGVLAHKVASLSGKLLLLGFLNFIYEYDVSMTETFDESEECEHSEGYFSNYKIVWIQANGVSRHGRAFNSD